MLKSYTFAKSSSGIYGDAFEMFCAFLLGRRFPDRVFPAGKADIRFGHHCYDFKQNGTVLQYCEDWGMIQGSTKVVYSSHIAYNTIYEDDNTITIEIDLKHTNFYCVDRKSFIDFLLSNGLAKENRSRGTVNVQTGWNYKKNNWHGLTGKRIEKWCLENENDEDGIVNAILEAYETYLEGRE